MSARPGKARPLRLLRRWLLPAALLALLAAALLGDAWLLQRGDQYYRELNATRLDPLGLDSFPATPDPAPPGVRTVVLLGDSRAAQWPAPALPAGLRLVNRGVGGQTTAQVLGRYAAHVAPLRPDVVVIQVGINDLKAIPLFPERRDAIVARCVANIRATVEAAHAGGARVVLTTVIPAGDPPPERAPYWSPDVAAAVAEVNRALLGMAGPQTAVLDAAPLLADGRGALRREYQADQLHLNAQGYAALTAALLPLLAGGT